MLARRPTERMPFALAETLHITLVRNPLERRATGACIWSWTTVLQSSFNRRDPCHRTIGLTDCTEDASRTLLVMGADSTYTRPKSRRAHTQESFYVCVYRRTFIAYTLCVSVFVYQRGGKQECLL